MKNWRLSISSVLAAAIIIGCSSKSVGVANSSTPTRIEHELVLVAHGDDWQIFAGDAIADYLKGGDFVTMVQLTNGSGDICWDKGFLASVWTAIEGSLKTIPCGGTSYGPFNCQTITVNGHSLFNCWYKNATVYFLRISGTWDYSTGHRPDEIVAGISGQTRTLRDFYRNQYAYPFKTQDGSATYSNFDDLVQTIASISGRCTEGYYGSFGWCHTSRILSHNPAGTLAPGKYRDHEDHATTGCIALEVAESIAAIDVRLFSGYDNAFRPDSQPATDYATKERVFIGAFGGSAQGHAVDVNDLAYVGPKGWLRYTTWGSDTLPPREFPDEAIPFWLSVGSACKQLRTSSQ